MPLTRLWFLSRDTGGETTIVIGEGAITGSITPSSITGILQDEQSIEGAVKDETVQAPTTTSF